MALLASLLSIVALTMRPADSTSELPRFLCVRCGTRGTADTILNVMLFVPFGAAMGAMRYKWKHAVVASLLLSLAIEFAQVFLPGRAPTMRDIIMNGTGGLVGVWTAAHLPAWMNGVEGATRRAWLMVLAVAVLCSASVWLLSPAFAADQYFAQVSPRLGHLEPWTGRVDTLRVGSATLTHGRVTPDAELRATLGSSFDVLIAGSHGSATSRLGAIAAITDERRNEILLVGPHGKDLVVRWQRNASVLGLDAPWVRLPDAFASAREGAPMRLSLTAVGDSLCARVDGRELGCAHRFGIARSWALLMWRDKWPSVAQRAVDLATMLLLVLPVGLSARLALGHTRWLAPTVAMFAAGVLPSLFGAPHPAALEWVALLLGAFVPLTAAHFARQRVVARSTGP